MKMALRLALKGRGMTSPNPMVGSVIINNGKIAGSGYHRRAGEAHAEINALKRAKKEAQGGEMYVNLEPCCHFNRTPPCTSAIIQSGIRKVVVGMRDPNPKVAGKGISELRKAGIEVEVGILEDKCRGLNECFITYITCHRPFVILKIAESLDGKIATYTGESKWITNEDSRRFAHKLRSQVDAVLVGVDTVIKDNPLLTARMIKNPVKQPKRIVLDSSLRIPLESDLLNSKRLSDIIIAVTKNAPVSRVKQLSSKGAEIIIVDEKDGMVDIKDILTELGKRDVTSLLVEGGAKVNASFAASGLIDKVMIFIGGCIIGGEKAPSSVGGTGFDDLAKTIKIEYIKLKRFKNDIMIEGYVTKNF